MCPSDVLVAAEPDIAKISENNQHNLINILKLNSPSFGSAREGRSLYGFPLEEEYVAENKPSKKLKTAQRATTTHPIIFVGGTLQHPNLFATLSSLETTSKINRVRGIWNHKCTYWGIDNNRLCPENYFLHFKSCSSRHSVLKCSHTCTCEQDIQTDQSDDSLTTNSETDCPSEQPNKDMYNKHRKCEVLTCQILAANNVWTNLVRHVSFLFILNK